MGQWCCSGNSLTHLPPLFPPLRSAPAVRCDSCTLQGRCGSQQTHHTCPLFDLPRSGCARAEKVQPPVVSRPDDTGHPRAPSTLRLVTRAPAAFETVLRDEEADMDIFIDSCFILDLCLNFFTGYILDSGEVEMRPRKVVSATCDPAKIPSTSCSFCAAFSSSNLTRRLSPPAPPPPQALHYLRGWFAMDFITSFPFDIVADFSSRSYDVAGNEHSQTGSMWNIFRVLRFAKVRSHIQTARSTHLTGTGNQARTLVTQLALRSLRRRTPCSRCCGCCASGACSSASRRRRRSGCPS